MAYTDARLQRQFRPSSGSSHPSFSRRKPWSPGPRPLRSESCPATVEAHRRSRATRPQSFHGTLWQNAGCRQGCQTSAQSMKVCARQIDEILNMVLVKNFKA
jgi:hypothetical protein